MRFTTPPPAIPAEAEFIISFPTEHVLHVAFDRPSKLNALTVLASRALDRVWDWYETEPTLRCAILGSTSARAWCTGGDLKDLIENIRHGDPWPPTGLAGLSKRMLNSRRRVGGAVEMLSNLDVVIAGESAVLSLPEAKRSVPAAGGGLPRFVYLIGRQKASELLMTGKEIPAREAERLGLVTTVVPDSEVEERALEMAKQTAANSPDAVQLALYGMRLAEEEMGAQRTMERIMASRQMEIAQKGPNVQEGIRAFLERRPPQWVNSKL